MFGLFKKKKQKRGNLIALFDWFSSMSTEKQLGTLLLCEYLFLHMKKKAPHRKKKKLLQSKQKS